MGRVNYEIISKDLPDFPFVVLKDNERKFGGSKEACINYVLHFSTQESLTVPKELTPTNSRG